MAIPTLKGGPASRSGRSRGSTVERTAPCWALMALLVAAFAMGGGSRDDIISLVVLRPLSFLFLAVGLLTLKMGQVRVNRAAFAIAFGIVALAALHLVPLAPDWWHRLPGRTLIAEVDRLSGAGDANRPLTMNPIAGWNAFYSLAAPLAAFILAVQLDLDQRKRIRNLLIGLGIASALLGLVQAIGPEKGPLYLYRITNASSPVGLFANRNHNALFLASLLPLLALVAAGAREPARGRRDRRPLVVAFSLGTGMLIVSVVVASGSRAGLGALLAAVALLPFVIGASYRDAWTWLTHSSEIRGMAGRIPWRLALLFALLLALALLFFTAGRETALQRFASEDSRGPSWRLIVGLARDYLPWGSGLGSFVEVFQITEPDWHLRETYLNHAHNDVLEVAMTLGLPGLALIAATLVGLAVTALSLYGTRRDPAWREGRAALVVLFLLAAGSLVDYPLRTPSLACLFAALLPWLGHKGVFYEHRSIMRHSGR